MLVLAFTLAVSAPSHPVVWGRLGARPWSECQELGRRAGALLAGAQGSRQESEDSKHWQGLVARCPRVVELLVLVARAHLIRLVDLSAATADRNSLEAAAREHRAAREQALEYLLTALEESDLRREVPPSETRYLRAYAELSLGRHDVARRDAMRARERGDVQLWRTERMLALCALFAGDLGSALASAHRAVLEAPSDGRTRDRVQSRYVYALVLDRAGALAAARDELRRARQEGSVQQRFDVETLLPLHERLYLVALDHQAHDEIPQAMRYWEAYLRCPEPEAPERELAERHRRELLPLPVSVSEST